VLLPETARAFIAAGAYGHLVTLNRDGSPHVTMSWVGVDGDELVMATLNDQLKLRNIRRDPRVVISFEGTKLDRWGLREYLVVRGRARLVEGGAPELLQRLAYTYLGPDVRFPPMPDPPPGYVTRVAVDRFSGVGPWAEDL
jgi:PPOX class probable F420-dependent enzyme